MCRHALTILRGIACLVPLTLFGHVAPTSAATLLATISVGTRPTAVAVDQTTGRAYVTVDGDNKVSVIDLAGLSVVAEPSIAGAPFAVGIDSSLHRGYVANELGDNLSVLDLTNNTVLGTTSFGPPGGPSSAAVDPTTHRVYVSLFFLDRLAVVDGVTMAQIGTIPAGDGPFGVDVDPTLHRALSANDLGGTATMMDTISNSIVGAPIPVGSPHGPTGVAIDRTTGRAYVTDRADDAVTIIDVATSSVLGTIAVGHLPEGVTVDSGSGKLYVANHDDGTVSVIDTSTNGIVDTLTAGTGARGVAVAESLNELVVANETAGTVSIFKLGPSVVLACEGFGPPMQKPIQLTLARRVVPLQMKLRNSSGAEVTDKDIAALPAVQVTLNNDPVAAYATPFAFHGHAWRSRLSTNSLSQNGSYVVSIVPGDPQAYAIDPTCSQTLQIGPPPHHTAALASHAG